MMMVMVTHNIYGALSVSQAVVHLFDVYTFL